MITGKFVLYTSDLCRRKRKVVGKGRWLEVSNIEVAKLSFYCIRYILIRAYEVMLIKKGTISFRFSRQLVLHCYPSQKTGKY